MKINMKTKQIISCKTVLLLTLACTVMFAAGCDEGKQTASTQNSSGSTAANPETQPSGSAAQNDSGQNASGQATPEAASAQNKTVVEAAMNLVSPDGIGSSIGTVTFTDTDAGVEIKTNLHGLPAGQHGFHVHEKGDCGPADKNGVMTAAQAAGGHYDPDKTGKHLGPEGGGHKGDLPFLTVNASGEANVILSVKGVKADDFKGRALMIHGGGDNYSDMPEELGGGGARIACGVIK